MQARLKVLHDKANVKQVKLLPVTLIGRSTECNLKIASSQVSRNHCRITLGHDTVFVEDLGSANGTLVDGQLIPPHQAIAISPGARLIVGPAEFLIDYVAPAGPTIVLPRTGVPPQPELPSTEMIFPVGNTSAAEAVPQPAMTQAVAAVAPEPVAPPVVQDPAPDFSTDPVADSASADVQAVAEIPPVPDDFEMTVQMTSSPVAEPQGDPEIPQQRGGTDTVELEPAFDFGFTETASADPQLDSPTEFMFGVATPDAPPAESAPVPEPPKKGLKSLFSLFGRKEKTESSRHQATVQVTPPAASGVFLPTVDSVTDASVAGADAFVVGESDEQPIADVPATIAADPEPAEAESTDEDDGFQNFLSNL